MTQVEFFHSDSLPSLQTNVNAFLLGLSAKTYGNGDAYYDVKSVVLHVFNDHKAFYGVVVYSHV